MRLSLDAGSRAAVAHSDIIAASRAISGGAPPAGSDVLDLSFHRGNASQNPRNARATQLTANIEQIIAVNEATFVTALTGCMKTPNILAFSPRAIISKGKKAWATPIGL
jgi:hypothetical protein